LQLSLPFVRFQNRSHQTPNPPCDPVVDEEMVDCHLFPGSCRERLLPWCVEQVLAEAELSNFTSALIAFFIWRTHRDVRQATSSSLRVRVFAWPCESGTDLIHLQSVLRIFIESAGMWVFFIFVTFMVYLANETAAYIPLYLVCPVSCPRSTLSSSLSLQTNPILGISFCMMTIRLQLRKTTVVGSGNSKPPYNFRTASKEHSSYTSGSANAPNELMVFSSKRTVDDSTFDATTSKV